MAKKCVPAMARELEVSSSDAVRNNIIIILRDLCVRYELHREYIVIVISLFSFHIVLLMSFALKRLKNNRKQKCHCHSSTKVKSGRQYDGMCCFT